MEVTESFNINGRGTGILLNQQYFDTPTSPFKIKVTLQNGEEHIYEASLEFARKVPLGEVQALLVKNVKSSSVPVGSNVEIIFNANG